MNNDFMIENGILKRYVGNEDIVVIPDEVTVIGDGAFCREQESPEKIILHEGITKIEEYAFSYCERMIDMEILQLLNGKDSLEFLFDDE